MRIFKLVNLSLALTRAQSASVGGGLISFQKPSSAHEWEMTQRAQNKLHHCALAGMQCGREGCYLHSHNWVEHGLCQMGYGTPLAPD